MQSIFDILKLVRYKNLLFLAFIQFAMQQLIIAPILQKYGFEYLSPNIDLLLLIFATLFIAAGGYAINDYFDVKIDQINKPGQVLVGSVISKKTAALVHQITTATGIIIGLLLAVKQSNFTLGLLFAGSSGLLWFYSASYKRQFLTGNIIVALLAAISVLITGINAVSGLQKNFSELVFQTTIPAEIYSWVGGFALFSFVLTLIRELIKDMEDVEGDREMECRTVAIVWGERRTKILIMSLIALTIAGLFYPSFQLIPFSNPLSFKYILFGLIIPLFVLIYLIFKANSPTTLHQTSTFVKYIMLIGVLYSAVFYFLLAQQEGLSLFNLFLING